MKMKRDVKNHMNKNSDSWSYNYCPTLISYKLTIISHCQTAYPLWPAETGFVVNGGGAAVLKKVLIYWQYCAAHYGLEIDRPKVVFSVPLKPGEDGCCRMMMVPNININGFPFKTRLLFC